MQVLLVGQGFIGAVTLISSAPMTPSRLILFYMAMRMSGLRRRSFTLGIDVPVCLLTGATFATVFALLVVLLLSRVPHQSRNDLL